MTEKVLGFKEKDAKIGLHLLVVNKLNLVPVVSLKALEGYCNENTFDEDFNIKPADLLFWAKKEAGKK